MAKMTYAFWIPVDNEAQAKTLCAENGLTLRFVRNAPQMMTVPRVKFGPGARPKVARHIRPRLMHCRAVKECTHEEATALNEKLGLVDVKPEESGELVGIPAKK
jgi:hypothetical protein